MRSKVLERSGVAVSVLAALALASGTVSAKETKGPVTDDIGVLVIPKGAPIQIGGYWVLSGPDTALGSDEKRAVEVAIKDIGSKLVGNPNIAIVIGPACSSVATPGAPILWKAGITDIGTASTAPALTAPDRKPEYQGFVRTVYSDISQGSSDSHYVHDVMKVQKVVTVHDGSPYAQQLAHVFAGDFTKRGGKILSQEAVAPTDVDMHPLLTRIATEKPDVVYMPIFVAAAAQILRQAKDVPGLKGVTLLGSSA